MPTYQGSTTGAGGAFRAVAAADAAAAAAIFASGAARREYGRRGYARALRLDCATPDGVSHTYEAFIGRIDGGGNTTAGHNVWIYVNRIVPQ